MLSADRLERLIIYSPAFAGIFNGAGSKGNFHVHDSLITDDSSAILWTQGSDSSQTWPPMKYWEIIADNLSKAGWSWGCLSTSGSEGRTIWIADAHRGDGKRFVVCADEKLTALLELEAAVRQRISPDRQQQLTRKR